MSSVSEETSSDPLEVLHTDVIDLILQHLSWRECLTSSTVSAIWYELIGESLKSMSRVKINIPRQINRDALEVHHHVNVLNSKRSYRNIYVDFSQQHYNDILDILAPPARKWREVQLLNANFKNENFLEHFNGSVELLVLQRIACDEPNVNKEISFPRLTHLKVFSCNGALLRRLASCSNLQELHFAEAVIDLDERENFARLLANNRKLQTLSILVENGRTLLPKQIVAQCQFELKKFVIDSFDSSSTEDFRKSLNELLLSQSASLEIIDIGMWCGSEVMETCLKMPKLENLSCNLKNDENVNWNVVNLDTNFTVRRLFLRYISPLESNHLHDKFFSNLPNLKTYKAENLHFDDLISLSTRCNNLEELFIENFNVPVLPNENCFPNLKKFQAWDTNDQLIRSLKSKGAKNVFEELILASNGLVNK